MKAKKIFMYTILVSMLLTSCKTQHTDIYETNFEFSELPIENSPSMEEFHNWDIKTKREFKATIENISPSDCEDYFSAEIIEFLQTYPEIELSNLTIEQDHLSLINGKNQKSLFNLIFKIDIKLDTTNNLECYDLSDDVSRELIMFLQQYSYYLLKTKEIDINTLDQNGYIIHNLNNTYSISNETMFAEQPDDEYAVQTLAFEFFHNLSQSEAVNFIQENHVNYLVISFYNGIFDESTLSFNYEL